MKKSSLLAALLLLLAAPEASAAGLAAAISEPDAVLIKLTEEHLNLFLSSAARANGWPRVAGYRKEVSRGVHDFRYEAALSGPVLTLGPGGAAQVSFDIRQADLRIGRLERRLLRLPLRCDNLGLRLEPARQVEVDLDLRFRIEDGDLRLSPEQVSVTSSKKDFRLIKPSRCRHALLPKWLLWQLGKPRLRRRMERIDQILQARVDEMADELNGRHGLLRERFEFDGEETYLAPRWLETGQGSLLLGLDFTGKGEPAPAPGWVTHAVPGAPRSFVALSESFLNTFLKLALSGAPTEPRRPGAYLARLLRSDAVYTLIPGLRTLASTENVRFSLRMGTPPRLELRAVESETEAALIRILLGPAEIDILDGAAEEMKKLGTLVVDSGRIGVVPFPNRVGGASFRLVENEWSVSARGIEQNSELIAATLQELMFGEMFETRYDPLVREGVSIGSAAFQPAYFAVEGGYLVIGLAPPATGGSTSQAKR